MAANARDTLAGAIETSLTRVVRAVLGEPAATVGTWEATPLQGGFAALGGRVQLVQLVGTARVGATERAWRVVLKILAPIADFDDPTQIQYWKREPLLYQSGVLDDLPGGLRAPRCYGVDEADDGSMRLWLEHVAETGERQWTIERWALVARHMGQFNGGFIAGRALPQAAWLGGGRLRSWIERHRPLIAQIAAATENPRLRQWWPRPVVDAVLQLWEERETLLAAIERLPRAFGHGDAIRRNLLAHRSIDGHEETVAVDWEFAGHYALGEEVGQTLSIAAAFYHLEPSDLPALDEALFASYLDGLRDAGWRGDERQVRFVYAAHAALRNGFNAVGAAEPNESRRAAIVQSQGRTWEELAERRAAIRPFLLERAEEARRLMTQL